MVTPEDSFYKKHRKQWNYTKLSLLNKALSSAPIGCFEKGERYKLCKDSLIMKNDNAKDLIVELGCSTGETLVYLKNRFNFKKGIGFDLAYKKEREFSGCKFLSQNLNYKWNLKKNSVDCLVAMMIFEHLFDPWFTFREVKRVLSPNGSAFINLPLVTSIKNRLRLLFGYLPETSIPYTQWEKYQHWDGFHLHYFSYKSIQDLAKASQLKVIRYSSCGRFTNLKNIFPNLLCNEISFELKHI